MTLRRSVRLLCRAGAAALVAGASFAGAPAASADEAPPVVVLDPPEAALFLVPTENFSSSLGSASSTGDGAVSPAQAASLAPPAIAESLGAEGISVASQEGDGEVHVEYGGAVVVRLPAPVDATAAVVSLDVLAADEQNPSRHWSTDPAAVDPLVVADLGGNEFSVTLPADDGVNGPEAVLTFDGLTGTDPGITEVFPLDYFLSFTGTGAGTVTLEPAVGLFSSASCAFDSSEPCAATEVRAGRPVDLTLPASSLLRSLDVGRLDTAEVGLISEDDDWLSAEEYWSAENPSLLTRHDAWSASVNLPDDMAAGPYSGFVIAGDPFTTGGYSMTSFRIDVAEVNDGLHSDTGWVDDVRADSASSTGTVAGIAMLVVAGLITVVAVAPRRRPPTER